MLTPYQVVYLLCFVICIMEKRSANPDFANKLPLWAAMALQFMEIIFWIAMMENFPLLIGALLGLFGSGFLHAIVLWWAGKPEYPISPATYCYLPVVFPFLFVFLTLIAEWIRFERF